ncbi:uncharacterized protein TNIN_168741 [Trichonephila inaurata madagascariensis]|uniref:Uncharacterized protein n=1 Tax=Trichonephila inaurata madagascariensis TaxID=2747483 RepID=A0A8X6I8H2_9ARAC|nr:uncharacterized protein TNIN_168741 [Trichonephila inaurata madagascariensis]
MAFEGLEKQQQQKKDINVTLHYRFRLNLIDCLNFNPFACSNYRLLFREGKQSRLLGITFNRLSLKEKHYPLFVCVVCLLTKAEFTKTPFGQLVFFDNPKTLVAARITGNVAFLRSGSNLAMRQSLRFVVLVLVTVPLSMPQTMPAQRRTKGLCGCFGSNEPPEITYHVVENGGIINLQPHPLTPTQPMPDEEELNAKFAELVVCIFLY